MSRAWVITALFLGAACGASYDNVATQRGGIRPFSRVIEDGMTVRSTAATCGSAACAVCPQPSYADIIMTGSSTVAVVCYPAQAGQVVHPTSGQSLNINAGSASVAIDLSSLTSGTFVGDININSAGDVTILGSASTSTPTVIRGNLNLHDGNVQIFNVVVEGDVSFNRNHGRSALVNTVVLGNLNVHVEGFIGVWLDVFGDLNINRAHATLSHVGYGQNLNIHGAPMHCEALSPFTDANADQRVDPTERASVNSCPAGSGGSFDFSVTFDQTGLDVRIQGGSGPYRFGLADTGAVLPGWLGEDCLMGTSSFDLCHDNVSAHFHLTTVYDPGDVIPGSTTLFDRFAEGGATFVVFDGSDCYTRGNDPAYYPGCTRL